jgi:hypothetical protein
MKKNAWFEREVLPQLRRRFRACLRVTPQASRSGAGA